MTEKCFILTIIMARLLGSTREIGESSMKSNMVHSVKAESVGRSQTTDFCFGCLHCVEIGLRRRKHVSSKCI